MAQQTINIGAAPNDGTGDNPRAAFDKSNDNFTELYAADTAFLPTATAAATYQPLNGDLTAIAALTGTNTIYYRNAANSWAAVNVSTGLSFSGGNLTCTVTGGGDVFKASANTFTAQNCFTNVGVVVGNTAVLNGYGLEVFGLDVKANIDQMRWSNDAVGPVYYIDKSRGTTINSYTVVAASDVLGEINFRGSNGSGFASAARIAVTVNGTPAGTTVPGAIQIFTTNAAGTQVLVAGLSPAACNFIGSTIAAPAGYVGEYLTASASSVALGAGAYTATATLAIPAGDWDIRGVVRVTGTAGSYMYVNVYTLTASSSGSPDSTQTGILTGLADVWTAVGPFRALLTAASTTYYLNVYMAAAGTLVFGEIQARRRH